ncbi:Transmembrane BAX inhibitor motif-containing protein 4 [Armadillidium vulgare]|nr:Transmembrane BAX inhibitor motif-containing protein 4 [Armadillidium vulgare]
MYSYTAIQTLPAETKPHSQDINDAEKGQMNSNVTSTPISRGMGLLQKVYATLSVQLLLTAVLAYVFWFCLPSVIILLIALRIKRHKIPLNFFLLGTLTFVIAETVRVFISSYKKDSVLECLLLTTAIVESITLYTLLSRRYFSILETGLIISFIVVLGIGIMNLFYQNQGIESLKSGIFVALFSLDIVYETHMMIKFSSQDYITVTISLYLNIIAIFVFTVIGVFKHDKHNEDFDDVEDSEDKEYETIENLTLI